MTTQLTAPPIVNGHKLPIGIPDFELIRRHGYVYVDKTRDIYRLVTQGMFYFLARPRRFGKSVLLTTLKCLFQGKKELFEGLWIAAQANWDWQAHPVIVLDFNGLSNKTPEELARDLETYLSNIARQYELTLESPSLIAKFRELIQGLSQKAKLPVAILIDEYDKPIIDHLGKGAQEFEIAKANRDALKRFLGVLKDVTITSALRFVLLTGITRFSKVSIFSELNNLDDISMQENYATLLGYTQAEVETCFAGHLNAFSAKLAWPVERVLARLAEEYNGYRFSKAPQRVYNPFSMLKALNEQDFQPYWFESGTPSFLIHLLQQEHYDLPAIEGLTVSQSMFTTFDIEHLRPEALLFQTGYVTIKDVQDRRYTLDYPNQEVKTAFTESLLVAFTADAGDTISSHVLQLAGYLQAENLAAFFETMTAIFASIPYDIEPKRDEAYFHTLFYLMLAASGADARNSVLTCKGRIDLVVMFADKVYLIEFKCNQSAAAAIQQIRAQGYAEPYRPAGKKIILLGVNFSLEQRNIAEWRQETL